MKITLCVLVIGLILGCAGKQVVTAEPVALVSSTPSTNEHICPTCKKEKTLSIVNCTGGSTTLMACLGWYNEKGNYHYEPCNLYWEDCTCSNGHNFTYEKLI